MPRRCLTHLEHLVACDTTNPPRAITADSPIIVLVRDALADAGCAVTTEDLGDGCVWTLGVRGTPTTVFNCHLDTVPVCPGWSADPFVLRVESGRAIGLGACDIKGAAACLLSAIGQTSTDAAILFSTDEEAGPGLCVRDFLVRRPIPITRAVVAEPTMSRVAFSHRGLVSAIAMFTGRAGHASSAPGDVQSAAHRAIRWGAAALDWADARDAAGCSVRLNLGVLEGGTKSNVIAGAASIRFGMRPNPADDPDALFDEIASLSPNAGRPDLRVTFAGPALKPFSAMHEWTTGLDRAPDEPLAFWTEAALFSDAGVPAAVLGPGDIAQAHAADEWVAVDQLQRITGIYQSLMEGQSPKEGTP